MKEHATIEDVAHMAGVAKSTVSRFLNKKPVRPESARRIQQAIGQLHYEANVFARLSAKQSNIIGIILPGFDSTTPRALTAIDKYLRTKSYTPLFINTESDLAYEVRSIGNLARMNVDGIILVATYLTPAHEKAIREIDKPVIFMGQEFKPGVSILDDNLTAGEELGRYIAGRGLTRAGFLWVGEEGGRLFCFAPRCAIGQSSIPSLTTTRTCCSSMSPFPRKAVCGTLPMRRRPLADVRADLRPSGCWPMSLWKLDWPRA